MGKLLIQNSGSQEVRLKDLDLLKGFRGSVGSFWIYLEPGRTSVNEQLLQNQNPPLISLRVSQTWNLVHLFVVIEGFFFFFIDAIAVKSFFLLETYTFGDRIWIWLCR